MNAEQAINELYALFVLFRKIGIPSDDIHFVPECFGTSLQKTIGMAVMQEGRTFLVTLDTCNEDEKVMQLWQIFTERVGTMPLAELQKMWDAATLAPHHIIAIVNGMRLKGFEVSIPVSPENLS